MMPMKAQQITMKECSHLASLQVQMKPQRNYSSKNNSRLKKKSSITRQSQSLQTTTISIFSWVVAVLPVIMVLTNIKLLSNSKPSVTTGLLIQQLTSRMHLALVSNLLQPSKLQRSCQAQGSARPQSTCSSMMTWMRRREIGFWRQSVPTRRGLMRYTRSKKPKQCSSKRGKHTVRSSYSSGQLNAAIN